MAKWGPLRQRLAEVDEQLTISWRDLDDLVGGLPPSAYKHSAFWAGERTSWAGFAAIDVRIGEEITFVRRGHLQTPHPRSRTTAVRTLREGAGQRDVVLVGCVKSKLDHRAPARDLYTSPLFRKERAYAEAAGVPWFILSAQHGLVDPSQVIDPYELRLSSTSRPYRAAWGRRVATRLREQLGDLAGKFVEVHAGVAYVNAIRQPLSSAGATLSEPLAGLKIGARLAWYGVPGSTAAARPIAMPSGQVDALVEQLRQGEKALTPDQLLARGPAGLKCPGLYSWWVDEAGAIDLARGLGTNIAPGLAYAGLAGATRSRSGRRSTNTLWGRLNGMHLGSRHEFSTFRKTLGSILAEARGSCGIDEGQLTAWMRAHLRVMAVPVEDADLLERLETEVLHALDPPLNLAKMRKTTTRARITALRRLHGSE